MKKSTAWDWQPETERLPYYFTPTNPNLRGECRKAKRKNENLPVLQELYHGDPRHPLSCVITGEVGFSNHPDLLTKEPKQRFEIDFNHIRQRARSGRQSGDSADKWKNHPSEIWRTVDLANSPWDLIEFMCIMPVSKRAHHWITQDSAMGDIVLTNFDRKHWPWHLQSRQNFDHIVNKYHLGLDYDWFIDHLSNIIYRNINVRVKPQ
jgi:hypothetical protein